MLDHKKVIEQRRIQKGESPILQAVGLDDEDEVEITSYIAEIVKEDDLRIVAYNICCDHIHIIIVCEEPDLQHIVRKIKSNTARKYNLAHGKTIPTPVLLDRGASPPVHSEECSPVSIPASPVVNSGACPTVKAYHGTHDGVHRKTSLPVHQKGKTRGYTQTHLWARKFNISFLNTESKLQDTISYIENNRIKHGLPPNKAFAPIIRQMLCPIDTAFVPEEIAIVEGR